MSGALDYGVVLKVMEMYDLSKEDQLLLMKKIVSVEGVRFDNRDKKKKKQQKFDKNKPKNKRK